MLRALELLLFLDTIALGETSDGKPFVIPDIELEMLQGSINR